MKRKSEKCDWKYDCGCGWEGPFKDLMEENEFCCPTITTFKCPSCGRDFVSVNTAEKARGMIHIGIENEGTFSLSVLDYKNEERVICRLSVTDKKRVVEGIRIAVLYLKKKKNKEK